MGHKVPAGHALDGQHLREGALWPDCPEECDVGTQGGGRASGSRSRAQHGPLGIGFWLACCTYSFEVARASSGNVRGE